MTKFKLNEILKKESFFYLFFAIGMVYYITTRIYRGVLTLKTWVIDRAESPMLFWLVIIIFSLITIMSISMLMKSLDQKPKEKAESQNKKNDTF